MTLKSILDCIRADGSKRVHQIEESVEAELLEFHDRINRETAEIHQAEKNSAVMPAFKEQARIIHRARLEALQNIGDVRELLVDSALQQVKGRLAGMRTDFRYPELLHRLIMEALAELMGSMNSHPNDRMHVLIEADPMDEALIEELLPGLPYQVEVRYGLDSWGGVIARTSDEKVAAINTLDARLEQATPYLRRFLAATFEREAVNEHFPDPAVTA